MEDRETLSDNVELNWFIFQDKDFFKRLPAPSISASKTG